MKKPLWLVPTLLLAGCRSEQLVLSPPAPTSQPTAAAPSFLADTALTATVAAAQPAPSVIIPTGQAQQQRRRLSNQARSPKLALPPATKLWAVAPVAKRLARHLRPQPPPEGVAESGLGGIGFFAIGVVLALLAGLGALVNLIFSVGFFTGVGYAAAGLVVLFLLYSLLSGGKKKK